MILLVIDVQKGIVDDELYNYENFIKNLQNLIYECRKRKIEVVYVQHDEGTGSGLSVGDEGYEIADEFAPKEGEKSFRKTVNSAFSNKELTKYLEEKGEKTLIISGLLTNYCIDATVKSAFDRGYQVLIPEGCNTTFPNNYMDGETTYNYYNEEIWPGCFGDCVEMQELLDVMDGKDK